MRQPANIRFRVRISSRSGFTLVELLVGVVISAGVIASSYLCLEAGWRTRKIVERRADLAQQARVGMMLLAQDLRSACPLSPDFEFVGMNRTIPGTGGKKIESDNVDFATHNWQPQFPGEGDFCEVSYFVNRDPETGLLALWRRRDASPDEEPLAGGERHTIVQGVRGFRLEYYDGFDWYDSWGREPSDVQTRSRNARAESYRWNLFGLPKAVRISIELGSEDDGSPGKPVDDELFVRLQTVVFLPLEQRSSNSPTDASSLAGPSGGGSE